MTSCLKPRQQELRKLSLIDLHSFLQSDHTDFNVLSVSTKHIESTNRISVSLTKNSAKSFYLEQPLSKPSIQPNNLKLPDDCLQDAQNCIDLGTTNSCVAVRQGKEVKVIVNNEGKNTTPSVIYFNKEGRGEAVGNAAKKRANTEPERVIFEVKRLMGRKFDSPQVQEFHKVAPFQIIAGKNGDAYVKLGGKEYSPQQISALVLQKMKATAEDYLGEIVKRVVITVPAYFDDAQRQATKDAGEIAGLKVERIINEPTAAALAYGIDKKKGLHTIAVFDLGGGTFDISIIEIEEEVFKRLKEAAENAKQELSSLEDTDILLPYISADAAGPKNMEKKLSRTKLKELTADLLEKLVPPCKNCLKDAGVSQVDEVILVGGMTRMLAVQEKVKAIFGKEPNKSVNPDEAVAVGAAIQGGVLAGETGDILLLDVTPLSLGIEVASPEGGLNDIIIARNTTIPTRATRIYSTAEDNQPSVHIRVLQGERQRALDNKVLGTFELSNIEPAPRGVPQIEVTFDIDANGIVKVSAKDKKTNKESEITIRDSSGLSKEEIERMVREAEENKAKDEELKSNAELLNRAQTYCHTFEKQIEDFKKHKDFNENDEGFKSFVTMYQSLQEATKKKDYPAVKEQLNKVEEMMKLANELAQKMPKEAEKKEGGEEEVLDVKPEKKDDDKK
ncbi:7580_t:CDS:2 [Ambispora gerdemannii]|uniref:7580_t:CDS:1 n=1 Tax=Ambispora gerdemannii TaxID=144530 RepID=A0A9N9F3F2_9GLOM|nr:7580_t:CDS:2 [Ambispora gerdemannii]